MTIKIGTVSDLGIDSADVSSFYDKNWTRRIALIDERFYNWQFKSLPTAPLIDNCVVAYDETAREIAGVMGLNARPFFLGGRQVKGAELTTWVVAEKYRGGGAGGKILPYIQESHDVLIGMGISAQALPVYLRSGFRYLAAIPRYIRVYNMDAVEDVAKVDPLAKKLARQWINQAPQVPYSATEGIDAEADALADRLSIRFNLFSRDGAHLKWRYVGHPSFEYRVFTVRTGQGAALVALRKETAVPGLAIFHVTDCIGDESAMDAAFSFIDDFCEQEKADVADFYCTSSAITKYPLAYGWFSTVDDKCFAFPHIFHPVEVRNPATTSLIYWSKNDMTEMCDFSRLYITKEDADFDRPVLKSE